MHYTCHFDCNLQIEARNENFSFQFEISKSPFERSSNKLLLCEMIYHNELVLFLAVGRFVSQRVKEDERAFEITLQILTVLMTGAG